MANLKLNVCMKYSILYSRTQEVKYSIHSMTVDAIYVVYARQESARMCVCVCSNAGPTHYYKLEVSHKADRWRSVWSIFDSRTAWADHIACGTSVR